jgi:phosphonate transport system ATP-binding protein
MADGTTAVRVHAVSKTFPGGQRALDGVSLAVAPGEMVALIGASGSGKSTLIRHVAGLLAADRGPAGGRVEVLGRAVQAEGRIAGEVVAVRRRVGVIFQQFNLVPRLAVLTNVLCGLLGRVPRLRGTLMWFTRAEKLAAMRALDRVGIAGTARQRAQTLSGGQQQRAAIARAMVQRAEVILADEPIASLDPSSAKTVMEALAALNAEDGITVVVSLHQVEYARRYCPRTIAMRDGRIVFDGPSRELTLGFLREIYGEASDELVLPDAGHDEVATPPRAGRAMPARSDSASMEGSL